MDLRHLLGIALLAVIACLPQAAAQSQGGKARAFEQGWYQEASKEIGAHINQRAFDKALARNAELLERVAREFGQDSADAAIVISTEGHIYSGAGKLAEAAQAYERSLALMKAVFGPAHGQVAIMQANIARVYSGLKRTAEAKALYETALAMAEQVDGAESEAVRQVLDLFATFNANFGDRAVAQAQLERLLPLTSRLAGPRSTVLIGVNVKLAQVLAMQNKAGELDAFTDRVIAEASAAHGETDTFTIQLAADFARIYSQLNRLDRAEMLYRTIAARAEQKFGPDHQFTVANIVLLANAVQERGGHVEAVALYAKALAAWDKAFAPGTYSSHDSLLRYGNSLRRLSRFDEAEKALLAAIDVSARLLGELHAFNVKPRRALAGLYRELGREREAEALYKTALAASRKLNPGDHRDTGLTLDNMAVLYQQMGRFAEAEQHARQALDMFERIGGPADPDAIFSLNNLAAIYKQTGRPEDARRYLERGLQLAADHPELRDDPIVATMNDNLAGVFADLGDRKMAARHHLTAYEYFLAHYGPANGDVGIASHNIGSLYLDDGDLDKARSWFDVALSTYEQVYGRRSRFCAATLKASAVVHLRQNAPGAALPLLEEALAIADEVFPPDHPEIVGILVELGGVHAVQGRMAQAYAAYARASEILIRRWRDSRTDAIRQRAFQGLIQTSTGLQDAPGQDRERLAREAFDAAQWIGHSQTAGALSQMSARFAAGDGALARIVREQQDRARELTAIEEKLTLALAPASGQRDDTLIGGLRQRRDAIAQALAGLDERLEAEFPAYAELSHPAPLSFDALQPLLRPGELFIQYNVGEAASHVWLIGRDTIASHRIALTRRDTETAVATLRCGLDDSGWSRKAANGGCAALLGRGMGDGALPFDFAAAHELYKALLGPFEAEIAGKHLMIVASGALTSLPFQVLTRKPAAARFTSDLRAYASAAWLGTSNAITILPAASSLKALRQFAPKSAAREPYTGYGDPTLTGTSDCPRVEIPQSCGDGGKPAGGVVQLVASIQSFFRAGAADSVALASLCPLPDTAHELTCVAQNVGAPPTSIHTGPAASETLLKDASRTGALQNYRVVHFATHGLLAGETQRIDKTLAEPALVLSPPATPQKDDDGLLTASEVAQLKLDADWVILSACNTAGGDRPGAEALSGLTRAFFYSGARALLVSHWPVNSAAAVKLTTGAFAAMTQDKAIGRGEAMRRSIAALVEQGRPWEAHPSYWAPFVVVGEGAQAPDR